MYFDAKRKRVLLRDGVSLVDEFVYVEKAIKNQLTPNTKIIAGEASTTYRKMFGEEIGCIVDEEPVIVPPRHDHTEEQVKLLSTLLQKSPRYDSCIEYEERIEKELDFFKRSSNILFLLAIYELIQKFKSDGVVWGVGRGSSCSSLILYTLEVHDINPLRFDIPFSELSKEQDSKYGKF